MDQSNVTSDTAIIFIPKTLNGSKAGWRGGESVSFPPKASALDDSLPVRVIAFAPCVCACCQSDYQRLFRCWLGTGVSRTMIGQLNQSRTFFFDPVSYKGGVVAL